MVLTGPVPITNAVTEFSFKLFWDIFPNAVVLVAIGLFIFTPICSRLASPVCVRFKASRSS